MTDSAENDACPRCGCAECICGDFWIDDAPIPPEEGHSSGGTGHDHMTNAEIQARYADPLEEGAS